jgi:peroxiredoxin
MLTKGIQKFILLFFFFAFSANSYACTDKATLYIFLLDDCKICKSYTLKINALYEQYSDCVEFVGVFPNIASTPQEIIDFKEIYSIKFDLIEDFDKTLAKKLEASITPEVFLLNPLQEVIYQGRIDDEFVQVGKRRKHITSTDLQNALQAFKENLPIAVKKTQAIGCFINYFDIFTE